MWVPPADHPVRRMFAGLTEQTFITSLGVADTGLIDYLSLLLSRFLHVDEIHRLRSSTGRPLMEVVDMVMEASRLPSGRTAREYHRHIGDFALFWTGVFPESLERRQHSLIRDAFVDYCRQGKRSYYLASNFDDDDLKEESRVLRRLSDEFELCAYGLSQVRREWEARS